MSNGSEHIDEDHHDGLSGPGCRVPSCRHKGTDHPGPHKEINGEVEFWDDSMRPGYLRHREQP